MASMIVDHKKVLEQLKGLLEREKQCAVIISPENGKWQKDLEATKEKTGEKFTVLIIGVFNSGKSSMINALIGEELLPTGALPETGVIGELYYGEEKRVTMYPKRGKWKGGDEPFDLNRPCSEEIAKYSSIDNEAGLNSKELNSRKIETVFEKMVITWPLEILKDGVVLVDSPGINDPYSSDYIVNSYLSHADAIIYVMNAALAYSKADMEQLTKINGYGLKNIITTYTHYDNVLKGEKKPEKIEVLRRVLISNMERHSNLGEDAIHFVDSLDGLDAKMAGNQELLIRSGYDGLEKYLGHYLVEGKGKDQVKNVAETIRIQAETMEQQADVLNRAASVSRAELQKRIDQANTELKNARDNTESAKRLFKTLLDSCLPKAEVMAREYIEKLAEVTDLEEFEPETELAGGLGRLNPIAAKKKAEAVQSEFKAEFERRMNRNLDKWMADTMSPYLQDSVRTGAKNIEKQLKNLAEQLNNVSQLLACGSFEKSGSGTASSIALGLVWGFLTGNWFTSGISAIYGKGAFAKALAAQVAVSFGTAALLLSGVVVTLPAFLITAIVAQIVAIMIDSNEKRLLKMKKDITAEYRKGYVAKPENIEQNVEAVMRNVKLYLDSACSDMESALDADIRATESLINSTILDAERSQQEREQQMEKRREAVGELAQIKIETAQICDKYGLTD